MLLRRFCPLFLATAALCSLGSSTSHVSVRDLAQARNHNGVAVPELKTVALSECSRQAIVSWSGDSAHAVEIRGSWDNWASAVPLLTVSEHYQRDIDWTRHLQPPDGKGLGRIVDVPMGLKFAFLHWLRPGQTHFYKFIVDGTWAVNPQQEIAFDENGNENNVLRVPTTQAPELLDPQSAQLEPRLSTVLVWTPDRNSGSGEVVVKGSWDNWTKAIPLLTPLELEAAYPAWGAKIAEYARRRNNSAHIVFVPPECRYALLYDLPVGEHQYKIFVNGEWVVDHHSPVVQDDAGHVNNVVYVE